MRRILVALGVLCLVLAACENGTAPLDDETGRVSVILSDNPESKVASNAAPPFLLAHHKHLDRNYFHGLVAGEFLVELSRFGDAWVPLGDPLSIAFDLQVEGAELLLHGPATIPTGSYAFLRLTALNASTLLDPGSEVSGETVPEAVVMALGGAGGLSIEIRLAAPVLVSPGADIVLGIDLNTEGWVSEENVQLGTVPPTDVETSLSVSPRDAVMGTVRAALRAHRPARRV